MPKKDKLDLIEELTTYKSDFKVWPLYPLEPFSGQKSKEEPVVKPPPPCIQIDPQSHAPYNPAVHVPFDLYLKPKPIIGTDPRECFSLNKPSQEKRGGEANKLPTILSPCLPLWDVENEKDLDIILKYTYMGMHKVLMEEAALEVPKKPHDTIRRVVAEGNDLRFKPILYPPLPRGWITAARHWDSLQSRFLGDPFKTFWTRRGPEIECGCCCNPLPNMIPKEAKDEIDRLICEDKLSLAYDVTMTNYGGYRPMVAKGVPLEKNKPSSPLDENGV